MDETTQQPNVDDETKAILAAKQRLGIRGRVLVIQTTNPEDDSQPGPRLAFRRPTPAEWHRYRTESLTPDPAVKANAYQSIVIPCLVYPDQATFGAMVNERPGLIELAASELVEFAGAEHAKKVAKL